MKIFRFAALLFAFSASILLAQSAASEKDETAVAPIVDVHASPYRPVITYTVNLSHQLGGPTWIDLGDDCAVPDGHWA